MRFIYIDGETINPLTLAAEQGFSVCERVFVLSQQSVIQSWCEQQFFTALHPPAGTDFYLVEHAARLCTRLNPSERRQSYWVLYSKDRALCQAFLAQAKAQAVFATCPLHYASAGLR